MEGIGLSTNDVRRFALGMTLFAATSVLWSTPQSPCGVQSGRMIVLVSNSCVFHYDESVAAIFRSQCFKREHDAN